MRLPGYILPTLVLGVALSAPPPAPALTPQQGETLVRAVAEAGDGNWSAAMALAGESHSAVARDVVTWLRLRDGIGDWSEYTEFLARNPDWPSLALVRRHAERTMPVDLPIGAVLTFFAAEPPLTGTGALRFAAALEAEGRADAATGEILRAWRTMSMTPAERDLYLSERGTLVGAYHVQRLDDLLWRGLTSEAEAMLPLVDADWQALAKARIAVRRDTEGLTALMAAVPASLKDDPGLAYERYLYRVTKGRWDDAEDYLRARSTSAAALGRPDLWMERRANLARQALRNGDVPGAYALAANNFAEEKSGADYADAEWVAGFIALTRMDDPERAAGHFRHFAAAVATPISLGRAGYWLGLAEERAGDADAAQAAFEAGARHQTSFYGQLAAEKAGVAADLGVAGDARKPDWRWQPFVSSSVVQAAYLLNLGGDDALAMLFLRHAGRSLPPEQRAALAQMAFDIGRPHMGVRMAKDAASDGEILANQYYPLHDLARASLPTPTEFALAIARQESEFNPRAVSPAGARGLMQLMPATAEEVSGKLGIGFDLGRLTSDPMYNVQLGSSYLSRLLNAYDGSYVLATAAYNAGPGRVRDWIATYGDPRLDDVDTVTWIESIPYEETRNYVMRVLESLHVYRARLDGAPRPFRLAADIKHAG